MPLEFIQTNVTLGSLGIIAAIVAGFVALWQVSPRGNSTVELWQSRCEILERELSDAKEKAVEFQQRTDALTGAAHEAELAVKDREREIAELHARPDTAQMLSAFEMNQTAVLKVLDNISNGLVTLSTGVETLIHRDQDGRTSDA